MRAAIVASLLCLLVGRASALCPVGPSGNTRTWTSASALNFTAWSNPLNWSGAVAPSCGDDLVFPASAPHQSMTNDLSPTVFNSVSFTGGNYQLAGNQLLVGHGGITQAANATVQIQVGIATYGPQTWSLNGPPGSFSLPSNGTSLDLGDFLTITGSGTHTFNGTVIHQSVGNITYGGSVTLDLMQTSEPDFAGTVVNGSATIDAFRVTNSGGIAFNSGATLNVTGPSSFGTIAFNAGSTYTW
jgi:hypothetical protein